MSKLLHFYIVNLTGFSPHSDWMKEIREFSIPRHTINIGSFRDLQVSHFSTKEAESLKHFWHLLKLDNICEWTTADDQVFQNARMILSKITDLTFYDVNHQTDLHLRLPPFWAGIHS
jgi:hypothetical protein